MTHTMREKSWWRRDCSRRVIGCGRKGGVELEVEGGQGREKDGCRSSPSKYNPQWNFSKEARKTKTIVGVFLVREVALSYAPSGSIPTHAVGSIRCNLCLQSQCGMLIESVCIHQHIYIS